MMDRREDGANNGVQQPVPGVHPDIRAYVDHLEEDAGLHKVGERTYFATGYGSNISFIEGDEGVILVNAGISIGWSKLALEKFRKISKKPIVAVIYTHGYTDHIGGSRAFVPKEAEGGVKVYCQADWRDLIAQTVGPQITEVSIRGGAQMGSYLPHGEDGTWGSILSRWLPMSGGNGFLAPTEDIRERTSVVICGVALELIPAPHDVDVGLMVWMPDEKIIFSGDVLMPGFMYPTIATPRFEPRRDPQAWVHTMGVAASLNAEALIPAYGSFVTGAKAIKIRLIEQRKLAQFLIDETYRQLLTGATAQEIAERIKIPDSLEKQVKYSELYHRLHWIVRSLISRDFGWFNGDPLDYVRHPPTERALRIVKEFGGLDNLIQRAREVYEAQDFRWAAELATEALVVDADSATAKEIRLASLRALAYASNSSNERNVLLTSCMMESGTLSRETLIRLVRGTAPSEISLLREPSRLLDILGPKLNRDKAVDLRLWVQIELSDRNDILDFSIEDGVMQRGPDFLRESPDLVLSLDYYTLTSGIQGNKLFDDIAADQEVNIVLGEEYWHAFLNAFDW